MNKRKGQGCVESWVLGVGVRCWVSGNWFAHDRVPHPQKHLQAPSDIGGSGGVPRRATVWETEARSVLAFIAQIVNTEGPMP